MDNEFKITYTQQALSSLQNSFEYLRDQGVSENKLLDILELIRSKTELLKLNPYIGQNETLLTDLKRGHRRLVEGNFKIIYYIQEKTIFITDIFDSRQDPDKMKG